MKRIKPTALWPAVLLVIALCLLIGESDLLWKVQQYNLFLYSKHFFLQQMLVPGGLLSYAGCFFTQHFYHAWLGVVLLCGWWALLMWMTKRTFRITDRWIVLTLIPVVILLVADMCLGYWLYAIKLRGYFFVATIGTTAVVGLLWAFRSLPQKLPYRGLLMLLTAIAGYPLMGAYALAAVLLMGVFTWRLSGNKTQNSILTLIALLTIIAVPLIYYRLVYNQTNLADLWTTALPVFAMREKYPAYDAPYYLLAAFFLILTATYRQEWSVKRLAPYKYWGAQTLLLAVMAGCTWHFWYKDKNFHRELAMERCVEQCDWEGVIREGKKQDGEPTRAIVMMYNLALSRLGRQLDEMYNFPKGSKKPNTPLPVYMYHIAGRLIYYQYGMLNDCHRICMEEGVEYGWRPELLQYMARCSILMNEDQAARKFLDLLRETQYYGEWADQMEPLIGHPEKMAEAQETGPITHMMHYKNRLGGDQGYVERHLMMHLSKNDANDPYFQEQALLATLWTRNPDDFWLRFEKYVSLRPHPTMPRIFQEAAYLFADMQNKDVRSLPFDQGVVRSYEAFMQQLERYDGATLEQAKTVLYPYFGNTYFYEYFFLKDITYM